LIKIVRQRRVLTGLRLLRLFLSKGTHSLGEGFSLPVNINAKAFNLTSKLLVTSNYTPRIYVNMTELQESASMLGLAHKMIDNEAVIRPTIFSILIMTFSRIKKKFNWAFYLNSNPKS
jgi:hypothetical protein